MLVPFYVVIKIQQTLRLSRFSRKRGNRRKTAPLREIHSLRQAMVPESGTKKSAAKDDETWTRFEEGVDGNAFFSLAQSWEKICKKSSCAFSQTMPLFP